MSSSEDWNKIENTGLIDIFEPQAFRVFNTGAIRDADHHKIDPEAAFSPLVFNAYCQFMFQMSYLYDGTRRDEDNWQKGMGINSYMKSSWRHFLDLWSIHRGLRAKEHIVFVLCYLLFNISGYLHEYLEANPDALAEAVKQSGRSPTKELV